MNPEVLKNSIILFSTALIGGLLAFPLSKVNAVKFKTILTFSGSYLFSLTIVHFLPEVFEMTNASVSGAEIGVFLLVGFFVQKILEYFSQGIEHGHLHIHEHGFSAMSILIALCVHSFLEGSVLIPNMHHHSSMLLGIVFHTVPAAFVLTTILLAQLDNTKKTLLYLFIFVISSPLGLMVSNFMYVEKIISPTIFIYLFAGVAGNFLHISTTIFHESNPEHRFNLEKLLAIVLGVGGALLTQYYQ